MPGFTGHEAAFTPSLTDDNYTLEANATTARAKVRSVTWGGELITSTAYRTNWTRPTAAGVGAATAGQVEATNPKFATSGMVFATTYATTQPAQPTAPKSLYTTSWNAHGGLGILVLPPGQEWEVMNGLLGDSISCINLVGVDANGSSYGIGWDE